MDIEEFKNIVCNVTNSFHIEELKEVTTFKDIEILISNLNAKDYCLLVNSKSFTNWSLSNKFKINK